MKTYTVIGLGRFGRQLAARLYEYGEDVLAIDANSSLVNDIANKVTRAVTANAEDISVLRTLGVQNADCAIVAIGTNLASSLLITMNLKNLGVREVICKAHDDTHREILEKIGADRVIFPERIIADKTAEMLASPNILDEIELSEEYGIMELKTPSGWIGKTLEELNVRNRYGIDIIAVKENDRIKVSPTSQFVIPDGAVLVLLGEYAAIDKVKKLV
ncbi:MAG: TrkA family potassium uptake protein [Oscillospiraceae bacterium]|nr:TrkA family potassium uptake protein [Oscillospiraceae bacterium]